MAATQRKSILEGTFGVGADIASQIAQDTSLPATGYQDPPPGIKKGVAQLDEVKFDEYKSGENEGKPYFSATAIICEPIKHVYTPTSKGQPTGDAIEVHTAGMMTRAMIDGKTMIPMFDTQVKSGKNMGQVMTKEQAAVKVAQFMRSLGADTSKVKKISDLETIAETLTRVARNPKTPIYVNFRTSVRQAMNIGDQDGVWQNWEGTEGLENYVPPGGDELPPDMQTRDTTATSTNTAEEPDLSGEGGNPHEESSLEELVEAAQNGDDAAQTELLRRAAEATGQPAEEINEAAESWQGVADLCTPADTTAEPKTATPPKKGDHFNYRPMVKGLKGLVPAKKAIECSVTAVNEKAQTVTLKNTVDGKTLYKDVPWDSLEDVS